MKEFVFVKFQDGTSDVVHKKWLHGNNKCYWPPNESDVQLLVKQKADAKPEWQLFFCGILCQSSKFIVFFVCLRKSSFNINYIKEYIFTSIYVLFKKHMKVVYVKLIQVVMLHQDKVIQMET